MGWLDSPLHVHNGNIEAFFNGRKVTLQLIIELSKNFDSASKCLEKQISKGLDEANTSNVPSLSAKRKIAYQRASEDKNLKESYLVRAIEIYYTSEIMPHVLPIPNIPSHQPER